MHRYPHIIYWKWDRETLEQGLYLDKIEELCRRSVFDTVYVSHVWTEHEITEPLCVEAIAKAAEALHRHDRRIVFDLDVRDARHEFARRYPDALLHLYVNDDIELDAHGRGEVTFREGPSGDHYGEYPVLEVGRPCVYLYQPVRIGDYDCYDTATLTLDRTRDVNISQPGEITLSVDEGPDRAGWRAFFVAAFKYEYPDPFAAEFLGFQKELFELYKHTGLDGACLDEWGFPPYPGFRFSRAYRHPWWGRALQWALEEATHRGFGPDLLNRLVAPSIEPSIQDKAVHQHARVMREQQVVIEDQFYRWVKEYFGEPDTNGPGAFVGVHPTWYAIHKTQCEPEIWKNGFDWYRVRRDYAQTDEICIYPVRLALAHKWGHRPFYNMYYSMETRDIRTYIREMWTNARYGGRTHLLSYECKRENASMLELIEGDDLEKVSRVSERIALLDEVQETVPRSNVLVVMGYGAAVDHRSNNTENGHWDLACGPFVEAFQMAQDMWEAGFLVDLVPSYEIVHGDLALNEEGLPVYNGNVYDATFYVHPQFADEAELAFLLNHRADRLQIMGVATRSNTGVDITSTMARLRERCACREWGYLPLEYDRILRGWGIMPNDIDAGCRMADGLVVVTSHTARADGTPLDIRFDIDGRAITAEARDLFAIRLHPTGALDALAAGDLAWVAVDGAVVWRQDERSDVVLRGTAGGAIERIR